MNNYPLDQQTEVTESEWGKEMARIYQQELVHNEEEWTAHHTEESDIEYTEDVIESGWGKEMAELYETELKDFSI